MKLITTTFQEFERYLRPSLVEWGSRLAIFIVFFWFGMLKILKVSPADRLVEELHAVTIKSLIVYDDFFMLLGIIEVLIGILFLVPKLTRLALLVFLGQMFTTFGPMVFLTSITWEDAGVPSLTGQYIIKNIVLVMLGLNIYYHWLHRTTAS